MLKRLILKNKCRLVLGFLMFSTGSVFADGVVHDPLNFIQNEITAQKTTASLIKQIQMVEMQIQSMKHLDHIEFKDLADIIRRIDGITKQGSALSYSMKEIDTEFSKRYPNYTKETQLPNYQKSYQAWNETSLQTFQKSMKAIGVTADQAENQQILLRELKRQSESANGQTQLLQVSHALALNTIQQLLTLKQLVAVQTNAQTAYMSHEVSKSSYHERAMQDVINNFPKQYSSSGRGYGKIEYRKGFAR